MKKQTPPFGKQFDTVPRSGVRVAIGREAWDFVKTQPPTMVLPDDANADDFHWPSDRKPALIHERGDYNDERLNSLAHALLKAGASSVVAIREALMNEYDPRVFYDQEVIRAAA